MQTFQRIQIPYCSTR